MKRLFAFCETKEDVFLLVEYLRKNNLEPVYVFAITSSSGVGEILRSEAIEFIDESIFYDSHVYKDADQKAAEWAIEWHRQSEIAAFFNYKDVSLGSFAEKSLMYYFVAALKRTALVLHAIDQVKPSKVLVLPDKAYSKNFAKQAGHEAQLILRLCATNRNIPVEQLVPQKEKSPVMEPATSARHWRQALRFMLAQNLRHIFNSLCYLKNAKKKHRIVFSSNYIHVEEIMKALASKETVESIFLREEFGPKLLPGLFKKSARYCLEADYKIDAKKLFLPNVNEKPFFEALNSFFIFKNVNLLPVLSQRLSQAIQLRTQWAERLDKAFEFIRHERPEALVFDEDVCDLNKALALAASKKGIYSLVVQHGVPGVRAGFMPLTAVEIATWGKCSEDIFAKWGIPSKHFLKAGVPRYESFLENSSQATLVREKLKIPPDRRFVLIATQPYHDEINPDFASSRFSQRMNENLVNGIADLLKKFPNWEAVIKLHPREMRSEVTRQIVERRETQDRIHIIKNFDNRQLLNSCEFLISPWSTLFIEALIFKKPLILLESVTDGEILRPYEGKYFSLSSEEVWRRKAEQWMLEAPFDLETVAASQEKLLEYLLYLDTPKPSARISERILEKIH